MGFSGYPFTHEWIFYVLEAVPMLPAVSIFCLWYPGKYLPKRKRDPLREDSSNDGENKPSGGF